MDQVILIFLGTILLVFGVFLGYLARQSIAKKDYSNIEAKIQKKIQQTKEEAAKILDSAKTKAHQELEGVKKETDNRRKEFLRAEKLLLKRENLLREKMVNFEDKEEDFNERVEKLKEIKKIIETKKEEIDKKLEQIAETSKEEAKKEVLAIVEKESQADILGRIRKLEQMGYEEFNQKAKDLLAMAMQKCAVSQSQELSTTTLNLSSEDIKGRIIGKEGRNIRAFEKLTGVELIVDETPETVVISSFDPVRRQVAKVALEKLIRDGRIQPASIEEMVEAAESEVSSQIKEAGEQAVYDLGIMGLDPKLVQLLGRLRFRTSYGQNNLLHSMEVAHLSSVLAAELGANVQVAKMAGLFHDIGKAIDRQIEGSHVDIGVKILERFKISPEVIEALKTHHDPTKHTSLEAVIIEVADAISGARPGARKDTVEDYLKRLSELESIANSIPGVEKSYAIQAGREIRVFVRPEEIDDLTARKIAKEIASRIQEELKYPGEVKVNVIRETRVTEFAK